MADITVIQKGQTDWHIPINSNFAALAGEIASPARYNLAASGDAQLTATAPDGTEATITAANLDTGLFTVGKDYFVFVSVDGGNAVYRVSLDKAFATGNLIGGFHYGKTRRVNATLDPINTAGTKRGSGWESNVVDGIVPRSVWTLTHRPKCSPEGMVYLGNNAWVDIYLASDDGAGGLASAYGANPATGTEGYNWYDFNEKALIKGKRLLSYGEWLQMAMGSPGGLDANNTNAWTATTNTARNGAGLVDRAVSSIGCRDAVGNVWEWTDEFITRAEQSRLAGGTFSASDGARGGQPIPAQASYGNGHHNNVAVTSGFAPAGRWTWDAVSPFPAGYGNIYEYYDYSLAALIAGGDWGHGVRAGARTVNLGHYPWNVHTSIGSRCACDGL